MGSVSTARLLTATRHSYVLNDNVAYLAITERSYPKKLALTYLEDVRAEFQTSYKRENYLDPQLRPYAYSEFDRFIDRTKKTYQDSRATDNLGRLNDELKDVTQVMTKNIEDLLYRGDSLEKMGMHAMTVTTNFISTNVDCRRHVLPVARRFGQVQACCCPYQLGASAEAIWPVRWSRLGDPHSPGLAVLVIAAAVSARVWVP